MNIPKPNPYNYLKDGCDSFYCDHRSENSENWPNFIDQGFQGDEHKSSLAILMVHLLFICHP